MISVYYKSVTEASTSQEVYQKNENLVDTSSTTTRTRARTREGNSLIEQAIRDVGQYYADTFGCRMPPVAEREIRAAMEQGMETEVFFSALDEAAGAPRPSWAYARAILRRCLAEGVKTAHDWDMRQALHARKAAGRRYAEREYGEGELEQLFT